MHCYTSIKPAVSHLMDALRRGRALVSLHGENDFPIHDKGGSKDIWIKKQDVNGSNEEQPKYGCRQESREWL